MLERDGGERRAPLSDLASGAALLGTELLAAIPGEREPLAIGAAAAGVLAALYSFGQRALERLRNGLAAEDEASPIVLWPEHFDLALEAGPEAAGERANYGLSPGDESHPEPYLYVGPWVAPAPAEPWNARGFDGAELAYAELVEAVDPDELAQRFWSERRAALGR